MMQASITLMSNAAALFAVGWYGYMVLSGEA